MQVAIVGAGTIIFQDEGIGVYASKYLEENYDFSHSVTLVDGGVLGFKLMTYYQEYDKVLILDTITIEDDAGAIYNLPAEELLGLGSYKQTAHEVEIVEMLEICSLLEQMADVHIIGIVPHDIQSVNIGLSTQMQENFPNFIATALHQLEQWGIECKKRSNEVALTSIIDSYANPNVSQQNITKEG